MHISAFVAALLLPYAASNAIPVAGGAECLETCFGFSCLAAGALYGLVGDNCATMESYGCDCTGCDCTDFVVDIGTIADVPDDYACAGVEWNGLTCDQNAYLGFNCHYLETRRGVDCTGCLCEEAILGYEKGDESCPPCGGQTCDQLGLFSGMSCEHLESSDGFHECDCSGCGCDQHDAESLSVTYGTMDCNGNPYPYVAMGLGNEVCDDDETLWEMGASTYNEARTWFGCLNCPELECDGGDCGDSCDRGETCALPLNELCADEDSALSPTQFGRGFYCPEGWDATEEATEATTEEATEAIVAADEDGSFALTTTAVFTIALLLA